MERKCLTDDVKLSSSIVVVVLTNPRASSDASHRLAVIASLESVVQRIGDGGQAIATGHSHRLTVGRVNLTIALIITSK